MSASAITLTVLIFLTVGLICWTLRRPALSQSLGGKILMPETNVMEGVTIGHFADPEGHIIGLVKNEPM